ncbi:hypothetical protein GCM10011510_14360 [Streptococcus himalayensis]|uniref:Uncharacterized protein n=1 Tax=Streptococcus himalayensis TaxID=1888195 RepID=A0A917AA04_9STRE|nr:hypothetical protein GCM10011510_14360 [Streptococcus himalayensis]
MKLNKYFYRNGFFYSFLISLYLFIDSHFYEKHIFLVAFYIYCMLLQVKFSLFIKEKNHD